MTGKFRRALAPTAVVVTALGLAGCQSLGGFSVGDSSKPSKAAMIQEEVDRNIRLAAAAKSAGQHEVALGIYNKLLRLDPSAGEYRAATGDIYFDQGQHEKALAAFDTALSGDLPNDAVRSGAYVGRGRARLATGDAAGAERDFNAAIVLQAANTVAINGLGVAADMQGRHGAAQSRYREALALDPGNERVRSNLGLSLALAARFDDAVAQLAPLATTSESAQKARYNLALTFGLMGRPTEARDLVATAIAPGAAETNSLFYAATRDAVRAEAERFSVVRPDATVSMDLAPRRQMSRDVVNDLVIETQPPKAPEAAPPIAKPMKLEAPIAVEPKAEAAKAEASAPKPKASVSKPAKVVTLPKAEPAEAPSPAPAEAVVAAQEPAEVETPVAVETPAPIKEAAVSPEPAPVPAAEAISYGDADVEIDAAAVPASSAPAPEPKAAAQPAMEPAKQPETATAPTPAEPAKAEIAEEDDVTAYKAPAPVVRQHLDKNDAFYAAMRGVVDELAKPTTPWGSPLVLDDDAPDQLASK